MLLGYAPAAEREFHCASALTIEVVAEPRTRAALHSALRQRLELGVASVSPMPPSPYTLPTPHPAEAILDRIAAVIAENRRACPMLHDILDALTPLLIDLLALLLSLAIGWLSLQAYRYLGVHLEARHRESLHSAIMMGVRRSFAGDLSREQIIQEALHYVWTSVPDAIRVLVKDNGILRALAEAKLREVLDIPGWAPGVLG